jgi:hypothetical protein
MEVSATLPCGIIGRVAINHAQFGTLPSWREDVTVSTAACSEENCETREVARPDPRTARWENAVCNEREGRHFVLASNAAALQGQRKMPGNRKLVSVETKRHHLELLRARSEDSEQLIG